MSKSCERAADATQSDVGVRLPLLVDGSPASVTSIPSATSTTTDTSPSKVQELGYVTTSGEREESRLGSGARHVPGHHIHRPAHVPQLRIRPSSPPESLMEDLVGMNAFAAFAPTSAVALAGSELNTRHLDQNTPQAPSQSANSTRHPQHHPGASDWLGPRSAPSSPAGLSAVSPRATPDPGSFTPQVLIPAKLIPPPNLRLPSPLPPDTDSPIFSFISVDDGAGQREDDGTPRFINSPILGTLRIGRTIGQGAFSKVKLAAPVLMNKLPQKGAGLSSRDSWSSAGGDMQDEYTGELPNVSLSSILDTPRLYAVKLLPTSLLRHPSTSAALAREVEVMHAVADLECVVRLLDVVDWVPDPPESAEKGPVENSAHGGEPLTRANGKLNCVAPSVITPKEVPGKESTTSSNGVTDMTVSSPTPPSDGFRCLVLEYCDAGELFEVVARGFRTSPPSTSPFPTHSDNTPGMAPLRESQEDAESVASLPSSPTPPPSMLPTMTTLDEVQGGPKLNMQSSPTRPRPPRYSLGDLGEDGVRLLFAQIVDALAALHGRNITHRDVKLENILLTTQPTAPVVVPPPTLAIPSPPPLPVPTPPISRTNSASRAAATLHGDAVIRAASRRSGGPGENSPPEQRAHPAPHVHSESAPVPELQLIDSPTVSSPSLISPPSANPPDQSLLAPPVIEGGPSLARRHTTGSAARNAARAARGEFATSGAASPSSLQASLPPPPLRVKLADFGLARPFAPGELLSTRCGSEEYAAPEMVMGGRYEPSGVDIWAAGVVLFALLTSHLPFTLPPNARPKVLYSKICRADFRFPDDLPSSASHGRALSDGAQPGAAAGKETAWTIDPKAKDLVRKMLQPDPRRRINWAGVRSHPWMAGVWSDVEGEANVLVAGALPTGGKLSMERSATSPPAVSGGPSDSGPKNERPPGVDPTSQVWTSRDSGGRSVVGDQVQNETASSRQDSTGRSLTQVSESHRWLGMGTPAVSALERDSGL